MRKLKNSSPNKNIPANETWLFEDTKALASAKRGLKQAAAGKTQYLGSFAKIAK